MKRTKNSRLKRLTKKLRAIKAKDIMTKKVVTTQQSATLAETAKLMTKARISGIPVMAGKGRIVGIVTATDLFIVMDIIKFGNAVEEDALPVSDPTVKFIMSTEVIKVKKNTTLEEIITLMKYKNAHTIPVFSANKMVGVIGRHDVFKNFYAAVKDLN